MSRALRILPALTFSGLLSAAAGPAGAVTLLPDFTAATFIRGAKIDNRYLPMRVGSTSTQVARGVEDGEPFEERDVQVVRGSGPEVLGVRTTTVVDRGFEDGRLVERTRDYFAQDTAGNVWYMGEDVTNFEYDDDGNLVGRNNDSAWRAGVHHALPGWAMPADQILGRSYYQEFAPDDDALDEGLTYALLPELTVGSTTYADVLQVLESSAVEPDAAEFKYYARGIGLIRAEEDLDENLANPARVFDRVVPAPVPLPSPLLLLGVGVAALASLRRRARRDTARIAA